MRTISPTISGILILLEVVVAAILSFVFLQDAVSAYTLAGGAMILLGAFVVTRGEAGMPQPATGGLAPLSHDTVVAGVSKPAPPQPGPAGPPARTPFFVSLRGRRPPPAKNPPQGPPPHRANSEVRAQTQL